MSLLLANGGRLRSFLGRLGRCASAHCKRMAVPGLARCSECLEADVRRHMTPRRRKALKASYALKKLLGICVHPGCRKFAAEGRVRCGFHLEEDVERKTQKRAEWVAEGLCCQCGEGRDPDSKSRCKRHMEEAREEARKRRGYHERRVCSCGKRIRRAEARQCWSCQERRNGAVVVPEHGLQEVA